MMTARRTALFGKAITALVVLLAAATAHASTLFSDLGSGSAVYDSNSGNDVAGSTSGYYWITEYNSFTPVATAQLEQIDAALSNLSGTNSGQLILTADSAGLPGTVLETWNLINLPAYGTCCTLQTVTPTSPIVLISGVQYWLGASAIATDTWDRFNWNPIGAEGPVVNAFNGVPPSGSFTYTLGAFDVIGVPEPGTFVLAAAGLAFCLLRRRRSSSPR